MDHACDLPFRFKKEKRQAVRGKNPDGDSGRTGKQRIPFSFPWIARFLIPSLKYHDPVPVYLPQRDQGKLFPPADDLLPSPIQPCNFIAAAVSSTETMENFLLIFPLFDFQEIHHSLFDKNLRILSHLIGGLDPLWRCPGREPIGHREFSLFTGITEYKSFSERNPVFFSTIVNGLEK